jgi:hypothetical protein
LLFLATAIFVLWQNSQVAVLWDLSYLLDTSYRIALGQVPYRDFPLVHPPLTFLVQAAIMRLAGRHYLLQIAYAALVGGLGTVLAWRILLRILSGKISHAWLVSLMLAAPLTVLGIYSIYPHPIYDCDCAFAILAVVFLLQRMATGASRAGFLTGAAAVLPVFFKQNMGLPFLLAIVIGALLLLLVGWTGKDKSAAIPSIALLQLLIGVAAASLAAIALIQITVGLNNYLHWTVRFAAERRLPGLADMLGVYQQPSFAWMLPAIGLGSLLLCLPWAGRLWVRILALGLLSAPFVGSLIFLLRNDDLDDRADNLLALWPMLLLLSAGVALAELRKGITLNRLMPFFVLAAIHGTFLSQQLWGSTYAIWPLLMFLVAYLLAAIPSPSRPLAQALAAVVCLTFLVGGGLYAISHERLSYVQIPEDQPVQRATLSGLRGMADRGPYLPDFEELIRFADREIPPQDGILLLPGEEPFFFATGRTPQFPIQIFDRTTDPYSPQQLLEAAGDHNIRWVIVKTRLQSTEDPLPEPETTMILIQKEFPLYKRLAGYDVYRR